MEAMNQAEVPVSEVQVSEVQVGEDQRGTAARSGWYRQLGGSFAYPADTLTGAAMARALSASLWALLPDLPYGESAKQALRQGLDALDGWAQCEAAQAPLQAIHTALFDNCQGRAVVSLYEKDYGNGDAKMVWEEVIRFYEHFGLEFDVRVWKDWPDHIGTELEFLHYLTFLEATSASADRTSCVQAEGDFLSRRLARWAGRFARQVGGLSQPGPYGAIANLIEALTEAEMDLLGRERESLSPWVPMIEAGTGGLNAGSKHWIPIVPDTSLVPEWEMEEPFR